MKQPTTVAVCSRSFSTNTILRQELLAEFENVKFNDEGTVLEGFELIDFLRGYEAAIVGLEVISDSILSKLPYLTVIGKYGVGLDKLDFSAMDRHGVRLGWTPGVNAQAVAELTLGLALNIVRRIPEGNQVVANGGWQQIKGRQLSSLTYGIIGCGNTGKALVKLLKPFGNRILVHDIENYSEFYETHGIESVGLAALLRESDIISLHIPKNECTLNIIDETALKMMKSGSYLINTARGGLVDEGAVLRALESGKLTAAAFDVLETEPPDSNVLTNHPSVYVTPHIAGSSEEAILAMGRAAIRGLTMHHPASHFLKYC